MVRNAMSATEFYILQYLWTRETPATFLRLWFTLMRKKRSMEETDSKHISFPSGTEGLLNVDKEWKTVYIPSVTSKKFYKIMPRRL